jgi:hypothetical protein
VTDVGLKELAVLKSLKRIYIEETNVTNEGIAALSKALPMCMLKNKSK